MAKAPIEAEVEAPIASPEPTAVFAVESNNAITVEDNTEALDATPAEVTETEVPLMDGFTQVNYV